MKGKTKRFIEIIIILHILVVGSVYYSMFYDSLTYGQVTTKEFNGPYTYNDKYYPSEYIVIIQGRSKKGNLKNEIIILNKQQYEYTSIGDYVDMKKIKGSEG